MLSLIGIFEGHELKRIELVKDEKIIDHEYYTRSDGEDFSNKEGTTKETIIDDRSFTVDKIHQVFGMLSCAFER